MQTRSERNDSLSAGAVQSCVARGVNAVYPGVGRGVALYLAARQAGVGGEFKTRGQRRTL